MSLDYLHSKKCVEYLIKYCGDDPTRPGLEDTPMRVLSSLDELCKGYKDDPISVMKEFENDAEYDSMVIMKDIEFYSLCEHHMLPFFGTAHIAYIPQKNIIGLSKLARLLEIFARRLQVQERIGQQVTEALMGGPLKAKGAACILQAKHLCVCARGVGKQHSLMTTSSVQGVFRESLASRTELMELIRNGGGNG